MISFDFVTGDKKKEKSPFGKPRIYFTCHPDDFNWIFSGDDAPCFEKISNDILDKADVDCALFYANERDIPFADGEIEASLDRMSVFVIAVSTRLLYSYDPDLQVFQILEYAKKNNRPVLPILMDLPTKDLLEKYASPEMFGNLQYIDPHNSDKNVSYYSQLSNYLAEHIISSEKINEIRSSFTSSVFLSYRKKDRRHADDLMRYMHNNLGVFDVAVWYDEFLPLGENWRINISMAMDDVKQKSNLFMLLVTPSVLEPVDGKDNFVTREECPEANDKGMKILPVEALPTDYSTLQQKLQFLPELLLRNSDKFKREIATALGYDNIAGQREYPVEKIRNMGLAYLYGIHVERNPEMGIKLLCGAAEAGDKDAMRQLLLLAGDYYEIGNCYLAEEMYAYVCDLYAKVYGRYSDEETEAQLRFRKVQISNGDIEKINIAVAEIKDILEHLPKDSNHRMTCYMAMASAYNLLGMPDEVFKTLIIAEKCLGDIGDDEDKISEKLKIMVLLGDTYFQQRDYERSLDIRHQTLNALKEHYCDDHHDVILMRGKIAEVYDKIGEHSKALEMHREILEVKRKSKYFGPEALSTLLTTADVARIMDQIGGSAERDEALRLAEESAEISRRNYPDLPVVELMFCTYAYLILLKRYNAGNPDKVRMEKYMDKVHMLRKETRKKITYKDINDDYTLGIIYDEIGSFLSAAKVFEEVYKAALENADDERCAKLAKEVPRDILTEYLALYKKCKENHDVKMAMAYLEKVYEYSLIHYGPFHEKSITFWDMLTEARAKKKKGKKKK